MSQQQTYLQKELSRVPFNIEELGHFYYGGQQNYKAIMKYQALFDEDEIFDRSNDDFLSREEMLKLSVKRGYRSFEILRANKEMLGNHSPLHGDGGLPISRLNSNHCGLTDHYALFLQTLIGQATPEQYREWVPKALKLEILGTYAQTELGHGSNVRALETTAAFEQDTDTLLINMPHVSSMKWWPGALGLLATHAVVYCRLIVKGKDLGYNAIIVQIRDEHHRPMPGVDVGDIGPKMGGNTMDAGYLWIKNVRVPRTNLLAKFQSLDAQGNYTQAPVQLGKIAYMTMMKARTIIVMGAMGYLIKGLQIVLRYCCFRKQGFVDGKKGIPGGEHPILDHRILQSRLFPLVGTAMALFFGSRKLTNFMKRFDESVKAAGKDIDKVDTSMLPELHATSAGMKAFGTEMAHAGLEEARKCCGGQGFTMSSGIAQLVLNYTPNVTYEGDRIPMALQTARVLLGALANKVPRTGSFAYLGRKGSTYLTDCFNVTHLMQVWETIARNAVNAVGRKIYFSTKVKSMDQATNNNHVALVRTAQAHTIFQLVEAFGEGIAEAPKEAQPTLRNLMILFALTKLEELPVVITNLTSKQGAMIDRAVKKLLPELRPAVLGITEAPGMSERIIHSCIARPTDDIYESLFEWSKRSPLNKPEYVEDLHKNVLSKFLNVEYLAEQAEASRKLQQGTMKCKL